MFIAIDFDGTCVTHEYPRIGQDIGAVPILKRLVEKGHKLILHTMRSGPTEEAAKKWFELNEIPLYAINNNPTQFRWTQSRKVYANLYIDDAALGAPLTYDSNLSEKPYIDWGQVEVQLSKRGLI